MAKRPTAQPNQKAGNKDPHPAYDEEASENQTRVKCRSLLPGLFARLLRPIWLE